MVQYITQFECSSVVGYRYAHTVADRSNSEEVVRQWFHEPLPDHDGKSPAELILEGQASKVAGYLYRRTYPLMASGLLSNTP